MVAGWAKAVGAVLAVASGIVSNLGSVLQKKAVVAELEKKVVSTPDLNRIEDERRKSVVNTKVEPVNIGFKALVLNKTWALGFLMQLLIASVLFIVAQTLVGPSLTPSLGSVGLIVLGFSALVKEKLIWTEYLGLVMIIASVFLIAFSDLAISAADTDFLHPTMIARVMIYTGIILGLSLACKLWARRRDAWEGTCLATVSGLMIALSNYWISPCIELGTHLITNKFDQSLTLRSHPVGPCVVYWLAALGIIIWSNIQAVYERQLCFKVGKATTMIPITHVPSYLSPPVIYGLCFGLKPPHVYSMPMMCIGVVLLLVASFIFAKREAGAEKKQIENDVPLADVPKTEDVDEISIEKAKAYNASVVRRPSASPSMDRFQTTNAGMEASSAVLSSSSDRIDM